MITNINWCSCCGYGCCTCRKTCPTCLGVGTVPVYRPWYYPTYRWPHPTAPRWMGSAASDAAVARA